MNTYFELWAIYNISLLNVCSVQNFRDLAELAKIDWIKCVNSVWIRLDYITLFERRQYKIIEHMIKQIRTSQKAIVVKGNNLHLQV